MPINRRNFLMGAGALGLSGMTVDSGGAAGPRPKDASAYFGPMIEDNGIVFPSTNFTKINVRWRRQFVPYTSREPQGTVVVDASNHFLYVIFENQTALRYGVGVGRDGFRCVGGRIVIMPVYNHVDTLGDRSIDDGAGELRQDRVAALQVGGEVGACLGGGGGGSQDRCEADGAKEGLHVRIS